MPDKDILEIVVLIQSGKIIQEGELLSDNIQVHPAIIPGAVIKLDSLAILRELTAKYPMCHFTWFADPISPPVAVSADSKVGRSVPAAPSSPAPPSLGAGGPSSPAPDADPNSDQDSVPSETGKTRKSKKEPKS